MHICDVVLKHSNYKQCVYKSSIMEQKGKITIYDISKKLNLSTATISRALNNSPKIKTATKELVLKAVKEMNYNQNRLALALKSGQSKVVGVIVPFIDRAFFSSVIRGIEEELTPLGFHVVICQTHENMDSEIKHIHALLDAQVDGIFISVSKTTTHDFHFNEILDRGKPLVFFDRKMHVAGTSSVTIDDFQGAFNATEHLIKQGCKRIAHFCGDQNLEIYQNRLGGYLAALKQYNLEIDKEKYIISTSSTAESGVAALQQLWELPEKPDALFSASDYTLIGAVQELRRMGIKIPEEVAVVGFSNEPFTKYLELPISSVDQTPLAMGKAAAQVFINKIKNEEPLKQENNIVLPPELYIRESSVK